jgi:predicted acetyltransferase
MNPKKVIHMDINFTKMKSIRHESTEQQQHLFSIAAIMAHKSDVVGQQQQKQLHGKTYCVF